MPINQPTRTMAQKNKSEAKTAGPQFFLITKMGPNAGGDALTIVN